MNMQTVYGADGLGRRIAKYRRFCGYATAADLARAIENPRITAATIANIESGRRTDVSVMQLLEIAAALGISPTLLLTDVFNPPASPELRGVTRSVGQASNSEILRWLSLEPTHIGSQSPASDEINELVAAFKNLSTRFTKVHSLVLEREGLIRNSMTSSNRFKSTEYELQVNLFALEGAFLKLKNHTLVDLTWFDTTVFELINREFDFEPPVFSREGD